MKGKIMILNGDSAAVLRTLPDNSVDCCVTSPPYYGLRDYGVTGQIGLETTPEEYIDALRTVFGEVYRVLKDEGTLWLNIGDSYAGHNSRASNNGRASFGNKRETVVSRIPHGIKQKELIGIPWMLAFALRADGWYLRQDIIWHKPNPIPESVKDRCTKSHEYMFLLSKKPKYYFDYEAIKEPATTKPKARNKAKEGYQADFAKGSRFSDGERVYGADGKRHKRDVWTVALKPYKEAHFATFPEELITPCILAGAPEGGVVLDPFSGAGTVGVVCMKTNRDYIGIELNPAYIELQKRRFHETVTQILNGGITNVK